MKIELTVIEDLGIKLYGKLPPVISEIVANAWDADSSNVGITVPEGDITSSSRITIKDSGHGMSRDDIMKKYLIIGRKRRDEENGDKTVKGRVVMGRKGIGKLSVFGVAKEVTVTTTKAGETNVFRMNIDDILSCAKKDGVYEPESLEPDADVRYENGTMIELTNLKRKTRIDVDSVRRDIAKHFSVIGDEFRIYVNGKEVSPSDKFRAHEMEKTWKFYDERIHDPDEWTVSGWIGASHLPLAEADLGLTIMARGKLIQKPTMFDIKSGGMYSYSYITGEIHAEFMDDEYDLVATNRQSAIWDEPRGEALREWCTKKLREAASDLARERKAKRERVIRDDPKIRPWLEKLDAIERKTADKMIGIITSNERLDDERRKEMATFMIESFEQKVFRDMVERLGDHPEPGMLLEMFMEWDVIEAREITHIVEGRVETIKHLEKLVKDDAKEVPDIHDFFAKWPWILDSTWTRWQSEVRYSNILREKFPDQTLDESDRRIDFVAIGTGDTINVVELKRPGYRVRSTDITQLTEYMAFVQENFGTGPNASYHSVTGYLVAGGIQDDRLTRTMINESRSHRRYILKYEDLLSNARKIYAEFEEKLEEFSATRGSRSA